ncbi:MAG: hypothetical protein MHM6MM_004682, partial [Cercozoa sp. M6MM]
RRRQRQQRRLCSGRKTKENRVSVPCRSPSWSPLLRRPKKVHRSIKLTVVDPLFFLHSTSCA